MDPIAITAALLRGQLPDVPLREGASMMARVASRGASHAVIVIAGVPVKAQIPPEVQAGATLRLRVQEVTAERVLLQIMPQPGAAKAPAQGQPQLPAQPPPQPPRQGPAGPPLPQPAPGQGRPGLPVLPGPTLPPAPPPTGQPAPAGQAPAQPPPGQPQPVVAPGQPKPAAPPGQPAQSQPQPAPAPQPGQPVPSQPAQASPAAQPGQATPARTEQGQPAPGQPPVPQGAEAQRSESPLPLRPPAHLQPTPVAPAPDASAAAQDAAPAPRTEQAAQQPQIPTPTVGQPPLTQHQRVDVQVEEPPSRRQGADGEQSAVVSLTFNSPALGQLDLRLELRGERILAEITAPAGRPHAIAHSGAERLRAKLEEVGLEPTVKVRPRSEPLDLYA